MKYNKERSWINSKSKRGLLIPLVFADNVILIVCCFCDSHSNFFEYMWMIQIVVAIAV